MLCVIPFSFGAPVSHQGFACQLIGSNNKHRIGFWVRHINNADIPACPGLADHYARILLPGAHPVCLVCGAEGEKSATRRVYLVYLVYLVCFVISFIGPPEPKKPEKPDRPKKPNEPDERAIWDGRYSACRSWSCSMSCWSLVTAWWRWSALSR